jgi:hypothetical protein
MSWLGLLVLALALYLAFKVASALLKLVLFVVALAVGYWFAAPALGLPSVSELFYVLGPDFGGRRIEEMARPSAIADHVAREVADGVVERVSDALQGGEEAQPGNPSQPTEAEPRIEPLPEPLPAPASAGEVSVLER